MFGDLNPLLTGIVIFVVLAATIVIVVSLALSHRHTHPRQPVIALPSGADAALWSIVEAVPDPRNHLALTRDLSGEVHITSADREAAAALYAERPKTERVAVRTATPTSAAPAPVSQAAARPTARHAAPTAAVAPAPVRRPTPVLAPIPGNRPTTAPASASTTRPTAAASPSTPIVARDEVEPESDDDKLVRTSEFFFAGEPRLNRF